jgi:hypothetical protein
MMTLHQNYLKREIKRINQTIIQTKETIEMLAASLNNETTNQTVVNQTVVRIQLVLLKYSLDHLEDKRKCLSSQIY